MLRLRPLGGPLPAARTFSIDRAAGRVLSCIAGLLPGLLDWLRRHRTEAVARRHLDTLPQHLLKDIGLTRPEIRFAVRTGRAAPGRALR